MLVQSFFILNKIGLVLHNYALKTGAKMGVLGWSYCLNLRHYDFRDCRVVVNPGNKVLASFEILWVLIVVEYNGEVALSRSNLHLLV